MLNMHISTVFPRFFVHGIPRERSGYVGFMEISHKRGYLHGNMLALRLMFVVGRMGNILKDIPLRVDLVVHLEQSSSVIAHSYYIIIIR